MSIILVPYHLDERVTDLLGPSPEPVDVTTVIEELPPGGIWTRLGHLYGAVADVVEREVRQGARPIVVSGDCTTSLATVAGLQHAGVDASIVWFDAHGDVQTLETTTSGYVGGLPLRILAGYRPELISERLRLSAVPEDRLVLVDARDLDPAEVDYLATARIRRCGVDELTADPPPADPPPADLQPAGLVPAGPLVLHVDLDVVDTAELPGLRFPAPGGPSAAAVLSAVRRVLHTGRVAALSVACTWYPNHDDPDGVRSHLLSILTSRIAPSADGTPS